MNVTQTIAASTCAAVMALLPVGCAHVKVDPIEVKTIHIVQDINIKVDHELDDFFAFQERGGRATTGPATTTSATSAPAAVTPPVTGPTTSTPAATQRVETSGGVR